MRRDGRALPARPREACNAELVPKQPAPAILKRKGRTVMFIRTAL